MWDTKSGNLCQSTQLILNKLHTEFMFSFFITKVVCARDIFLM